ncbi:unnamed protein product [Pleuronectes platessa]|uniref:Uncharacterized protein n=1 Tax=Pleuronectes platessa TaxID=8262 RepID=A0A9N7YKT5_PLEPL|nr:unnamed protein product [Pleuronectes platessa]
MYAGLSDLSGRKVCGHVDLRDRHTPMLSGNQDSTNSVRPHQVKADKLWFVGEELTRRRPAVADTRRRSPTTAYPVPPDVHRLAATLSQVQLPAPAPARPNDDCAPLDFSYWPRGR